MFETYSYHCKSLLKKVRWHLIYMQTTDKKYQHVLVSKTHHNPVSENTHSREEGLHVLIGVCYRRQVHQISVQHLLISVQVEIYQ